MTRLVSEHDQPHIRSPFSTAAPRSRLRRAGLKRTRTILESGVSGHGLLRFVHLDPSGLLRSLRITGCGQCLSSGSFHHGDFDDDASGRSHRPMAKQSGGEFASTNPTTRTQDARLQERRISTKISLLSRSSPQHFQRSTPSHFSKDAPSFSSLCHGHMACGHCGSMSTIINEIIRVYRSTT